MRYSDRVPDDHSDPWPPVSSASHAVSGHQPPVKRQYWPWWVIGTMIFLLFVGCAVVMGLTLGTGDKSDTTGYVTPSPSTKSKTTTKAKAVPQVKPKATKIDEGMFQVGKQVEPGRYKTSGMRQDALMCYWHTAKDTSTNQIEDQGVVDKEGAQAYVTLKKGQWFQTSGCATWVRQDD